MSSKKKTSKKPVKKEEKVIDSHIPGYLLIAFGILGFGLNYDLIADLTWAKPYPLLAVLFGLVALVKHHLDN
jgi:hypothetical protein